MAIEFNLENILAIVIGLITLNLLFIGFYIVSVLREVKKTVHRAGEVIDEVDKTVKDGIDKAKAMNAPLQALATTATAFGGIVKTGEAIKRATQSILGGVSEETAEEIIPNKTKERALSFAKPDITIDNDAALDMQEDEIDTRVSVSVEREEVKIENKPIDIKRKKVDGKRPRFFRGKRI